MPRPQLLALLGRPGTGSAAAWHSIQGLLALHARAKSRGNDPPFGQVACVKQIPRRAGKCDRSAVRRNLQVAGIEPLGSPAQIMQGFVARAWACRLERHERGTDRGESRNTKRNGAGTSRIRSGRAQLCLAARFYAPITPLSPRSFSCTRWSCSVGRPTEGVLLNRSSSAMKKHISDIAEPCATCRGARVHAPDRSMQERIRWSDLQTSVVPLLPIAACSSRS